MGSPFDLQVAVIPSLIALRASMRENRGAVSQVDAVRVGDCCSLYAAESWQKMSPFARPMLQCQHDPSVW